MSSPTAADPPLLTGLDLEAFYEGTEALTSFYVPVLQRAVRYDRTAGYFRASSLAVAAKGIARFVANGGMMRLVCGVELSQADRDALLGQATVPGPLAERLAAGLVTVDDVVRHRLGVLAWLVREGRLQVRLAVQVDRHGRALAPDESDGYFHEKLGLFYDASGQTVAMHGSNNESATAWSANFESFSAFTSWQTPHHIEGFAAAFEKRWTGELPGFRVIALPEAVAAHLVALAPDEPPHRDLGEPTEPPPASTVATFLRLAPHLPNGDATLEATTGVTLFPHQRKVVERLAGQYPRSWLVADEVGLGKTISAGMSLRRLWLSGQVERALILAPANVCRQWQDEMFEKFGMWVPRLDGSKVHGAHHDDIQTLPAGDNPYETEPILLVSSHLARRREHQDLILAAPPYDLLVVDEAHHARRRGADPDEYRPSRLLALLDGVAERDHARDVWLLTATPMQIDPIELFDLLRHVGLPSDARGGYAAFERFHTELAKDDDTATNWDLMARYLRDLGGEPDAADRALEKRLATKVGAYAATRIVAFGLGDASGSAIADELNADGRRELRAWIRQRSPVGRLVTRHTRETLRVYRQQGLLTEPIADRHTEAVPIDFSAEERALYDELDDLIDRLMQSHGTRKGAGFVLTTYRRRLTSSWEAIYHSFKRRLEQEDKAQMSLGDEADVPEDAMEAAEELGFDTVDESKAVPLDDDEREQMASYLDRLAAVRAADSKFEQLHHDVGAARAVGEGLIVFTQFTTTMRWLRDRLVSAYRSELATYSGGGGELFHDGEWRSCSKQELVDELRARRVTVVVCTDAASEGLNMQACSRMVNYDLPWNPMRVEQRIGRIDRIGQQAPVVRIRNYTIPGTVEEAVYAALRDRIDDFSELVGRLQPILGATEAAFKQVYRQPRSERGAAQAEAIRELDERVTELERGGLRFADEDPLPDPPQVRPSVDLPSLNRAVGEHLGAVLDDAQHPSTANPRHVSRDPEDWRALLTYGHPLLIEELGRRMHDGPRNPALVTAEVDGCAALVRADHAPPTAVTSLDELDGLADPVALGDAQALATRLATEEAERRRQAAVAVRSQRAYASTEAIKRRFRSAALEGLRAEVTLRRISSHPVTGTLSVWLDLTGSERKGWKHAEQFMGRLGLSRAELLPATRLADDEREVEGLREAVDKAGEEIRELIDRWVGQQKEVA